MSQRSISLLVGAVVAALVALPMPVRAAAPLVRVLEQSVDRTVVRIEAGAGDWASFALAIPGPERPSARILSEESIAAPAGSADPVEQRVYVTEPGRVRGIWTASVHVPLAWMSASGPRRALRVTVSIEHPARGPQPDLPRTGMEPVVGPSGALLNAAVAERFAAAAAARRAPAFVEDTFARSPNWLRIEIAEGGIYSLDYAALRQALGATADLVDPSSLRLFSSRHRIQPTYPSTEGSSWLPELGLVEHAIHVEAEQATLAAGDRILMFLPGVEGWTDEYVAGADWLDHEENVWATRHSFWLTWEEAGVTLADFDAPPLRMQLVDSAPVGSVDRELNNVRVRTHGEENREAAFGSTPDGWAWTTFIDRGESRTHAFSAPWAIPDSTAWVRTRPSAEINGAERAEDVFITFFSAQYEISGVLADSVQWSRTQQQTGGGYWFTFPYGGLSPGEHTLRVRNTSMAGINRRNPLMYVDGFDIHWRSQLRPDPQGRLDWIIPEREATAGRWRYRLADPAGRLDGVVILDVSRPFAARWVEPGEGRTSANAVEFDVTVANSVRANYRLSTRSGLRTPLRIEQYRPRLLRDEVRGPDLAAADGYEYLVLTAPEFIGSAEDLGSLRRQELDGRAGARVAVVELTDVYDQFGHGSKDPAALRNFVKFLYEVDPRIRFVALFGDANRDSRRLLPNSNVDWCPTWIESAWPYNPDRGDTRNDALVPFARDDWFVALDDPVDRLNDFDLDLPDLAVGRFPVNSTTEASGMLRLLEDYVLAPEPGAWKNSILLAADDEIGGNGPWETYHIDEAEILAEELLPPAIDRRKLYLTEYVNVGSARSKPAARQDFISDWSSGQLIVHYIGHGSPQQLADEVLFRVEDVGSLRNAERRPVFLAFSCDVSIFDDPTVQSMSEALVLQRAGGAIVSIAATYVTYVGPNEVLTNAFYGRLYPSQPGSLVPRRTLGRSATLGVALQEAKVIGVPVTSIWRQKNDAKYVILGDPGLRLQSPEEDVQLTGALAERIRTGQLEELVGATPRLSAGSWDLLVTESADSVAYERTGGTEVLPYVLPGNAFFSGRGNFDSGAATATLRTPVVMRLGQNGRVRMLLEDGNSMSVGLADSLPVEKGQLDTEDSRGPTIDFENFSLGETLGPGAELIAVIEDSSGVNVLGSVAANSILAEFDESGASIDFTDRFELDESSYTRGTVRITLPDDLGSGAHSLTLSAGDMVGNVTLRRVDFNVAESTTNGITRHAPFPNPFRDATRFVVEVSSSMPGAVELTLDLYTVAGAHVQSLEASLDGSGRVILPWEGRDRRGDEVANGTYLYVVRARFGGSPPFTETATGRVVLMR